jgi:protein O-mannosyl-transferase
MAEKKQSTEKRNNPKQVPATRKNPVGGKREFLVPVLLVIACFVLYGNTLQNGYALDDGIYTTKNDFIVKGFSAFKDIFDKGSLYGFDKNPATQYRPLTLLNFMAEASIFGFNPHVSHFFNILFFAFTVVLFYFFLQKILKNYNRLIILGATLLFAFHPIHTEVVANIKSRDEILGLLFGLMSFNFILMYEEQHKIKYLWYSLTAFGVAIFCKENCLTFVAIIPMLLYFFTSLELKKIALKTLPYIGLVALYLFIRSRVMQDMTFTHKIPVMDNALMSAGSNADVIASSFVLLGKYIYMCIIAYPLSWDYSYNQIPIVSWGNALPILSLLICAVLTWFAIWRLKRKSIYSFLIAWFFITLLLSSNLIVKIASTFGERFLYVPSLSFCIAFPLILAIVVKLNPGSPVWMAKNKFYIPMAGILSIFAVILIQRNNDWKSNYTLFPSGVITSPNSARTHLSLAQEYGEELKQPSTNEAKQKLFDLDKQETYRALAIYNKYPEAYYNLGVLFISEGMKDSALVMFQKTLAVKPNHAAAANNLGLIYAQKSDYANAAKWFNAALEADSNFRGALINSGSLYQVTGNLDRAAYYYNRLLKINPDDADTKQALFNMYYNSGKGHFDRLEYEQAEKDFLLANNYNTQSAEVTGYLGAIFQAEKDFTKAEEYYRKSLEINPGNESVKRNLREVIELQKRN